jgi:DNA-binding protein HU-beta
MVVTARPVAALTGRARADYARPEAEEDKMIKADIVARVAELSNIPRNKAVMAVDTIIDSMKGALCDGKRIELRGFGVFQVRDRKKGVGRNPKTGVEVAITPGRTVRFKPGKELKNL